MKALKSILILFFLATSLIIANAEEPTNVSVSIDIPDSQTGNIAGYFDLLLSPSQTETLTLNIQNPHDYDVNVSIKIVNGATSINGGPVYDALTINDKSLLYPLPSLIEGSNLVTLKSKESKKVKFILTAPSNKFSGEILGAFIITSKPVEDRKSEESDGISFTNELEYAIALRLRNNTTEVSRNLNLLNTGSKNHDYKPVFYATIQNDKAFHMGNVSITGSILNRKKEEVANVKVEGTQILPNTNFGVHFSLIDDFIKPGDYTMNLSIKHRDDVWTWSESISVDNESSEQINDEAVFTEKEFNYLPYLLIMILVLLMIILLLVILLFKRRKKEQDKNETLL